MIPDRLARRVKSFQRGCLHKKVYNRRQAWEAAQRQNYHEGDTTLRPYHCRFCGHWHVGHTYESPRHHHEQ